MKEVLITGYPGAFKWMEEFVGTNAELLETKVIYRVKAHRASLGIEETFWLGSDYVKELEPSEADGLDGSSGAL